MLPTIIFLYPGNTQLINITGLQDQASGLYLDAATISATLYDRLGNQDGVLNNISLGYLPGTNGNYQGTVPAGFNATIGTGYSLVITAAQSGIQSKWTIPAQVKARAQ
jgi:hypothetical protein